MTTEVDDELDGIRRGRDEATSRVVDSEHPLRLIVSGPGTGKSHAFRLALRKKGESGLALTFIKTLAGELAKDLGDDAATYTFHAYSKHLFHLLQPAGLTRDFILYPPLFVLMTEDLGLLGSVQPTRGLGERAFDDLKSQVERTMQDLDTASAIPANLLSLGSYYDAASFIDMVYRVFAHLQDLPDDTPAYPLVVVDEYQDFSRLETAFIAQLGLKSPLLIAGDDDQALYKFRHASPEHIRNLASLKDVERHVLPYCSRCTEVVVAAVNTTIEMAVATDHLQGRLDKPFACYIPDKGADSERFPKLIDVRCSIRRYMGEYIAAEIARISQEDIDASHEGRHPTALIVGPGQFIKPIHQYLVNGPYPQAEIRASEKLPVVALDGYIRLARDRASNLGWRILIHVRPFDGWEEFVSAALRDGQPLVDVVPPAWGAEHLAHADTLKRALAGEMVDEVALDALAEALEMDRPGLDAYVAAGLPPVDEGDPTPAAADKPTTDESAMPTVLCATLKGAKGLSAQHVFVVGLMNKHFPVDGAAPTDEEICEFVVALSRTRKQCHLISTKMFAGPLPMAPSTFLAWVARHSSRLTVDKRYWDA